MGQKLYNFENVLKRLVSRWCDEKCNFVLTEISEYGVSNGLNKMWQKRKDVAVQFSPVKVNFIFETSMDCILAQASYAFNTWTVYRTCSCSKGKQSFTVYSIHRYMIENERGWYIC